MENLKVATAQLGNELHVCHFIANPEVDEEQIIRSSLNAIVFKLQVILLMEVTEKSESSYYSLSYGDRHPSYSICCSYETRGECP